MFRPQGKAKRLLLCDFVTLCITTRDKLLKVKNQSSNLESILEERSHNTNALWARNERNSAISRRLKHHLQGKYGS